MSGTSAQVVFMSWALPPFAPSSSLAAWWTCRGCFARSAFYGISHVVHIFSGSLYDARQTPDVISESCDIVSAEKRIGCSENGDCRLLREFSPVFVAYVGIIFCIYIQLSQHDFFVMPKLVEDPLKSLFHREWNKASWCDIEIITLRSK